MSYAHLIIPTCHQCRTDLTRRNKNKISLLNSMLLPAFRIFIPAQILDFRSFGGIVFGPQGGPGAAPKSED